jgi:hypothetical protein
MPIPKQLASCCVALSSIRIGQTDGNVNHQYVGTWILENQVVRVGVQFARNNACVGVPRDTYPTAGATIGSRENGHSSLKKSPFLAQQITRLKPYG